MVNNLLALLGPLLSFLQQIPAHHRVTLSINDGAYPTEKPYSKAENSDGQKHQYSARKDYGQHRSKGDSQHNPNGALGSAHPHCGYLIHLHTTF